MYYVNWRVRVTIIATPKLILSRLTESTLHIFIMYLTENGVSICYVIDVVT